MAGPGRALTGGGPAPVSDPPGPLLTKTAAFIAAEGLLAPGQRVLVAFSGGPDSSALLAALLELGYGVVAGHVDHALRPGSAADARHAARIAARLGIPFAQRRLDPPPGTEAGARLARYDALEAMAATAGAPAIATGHTLDDDAETVLLRLARGGTPLGIPPRRGRIVRPFLQVRRAETHGFCARRGIPVLIDPSNADPRFARNRIRAAVLPGLGDPGIEALSVLAAETRVSRAALEARAEREEATLARPVAEGLCLDTQALGALGPHLGQAVLRRALDRTRGRQDAGAPAAAHGPGPRDASTRLVEALWRDLVVARRGPLDLPAGRRAWREGDALLVGTPLPPPAPDPLPLTVPGRTMAPGWDLDVRIGPADPPDPRGAPTSGTETGTAAGWDLLLAADALDGPLALRTRRPGDRYRPVGGPGTSKVQDLWVDAKVPRALRDRLPLLTCGDRLIWAGGQRVAEGFNPRPGHNPAVRIQVFPLLNDGQLVRSLMHGVP